MGEGFAKLNNRIGKIGATAKGALGVAGLAGALFLVKRAMTAVITTGAELEQTLVGAAVRFPGEIRKGSAAFKELEEVARQVGRTTEFTVTQTAGSLRTLALGGFEASTAMAVLQDLTDFATASETDLTTATDIAAKSLGAFSLRTKDPIQAAKNLRRLSDVLTTAVTSTLVTTETLFETISLGGSIATVAGVSLESFAAIAGKLGDTVIPATRAGTAIKNMLVNLAKPSTTAGLKKLGVQTKFFADGSLDIGQIIDDLRESLQGMEKLKKLNILSKLFGLRGGPAVAALIGLPAGAVNELREKMLGAEGATKRMAKALRDTRATQIKLFESAVESLTITFSKATDDGIGGFIRGATRAVRVIERFVDANPIIAKMVIGIVALAAGFLVLAVVVAAIAAAVLFIGTSAIALKVAAFGVGVAIGTWLSTLRPVQIFFDALFTSIFFIWDLMQKIAQFTPVAVLARAAGFVAGKFFDGGGEDTAPPPEVINSRTTNDSTATLTILDQTSHPGRGVLLDQKNLPSAIDLIVDESGTF